MKASASASAQPESTSDHDKAYALYADKIEEIISERGGPHAELVQDRSMVIAAGLCFAELVDFKNDGLEELMVVYYLPEAESPMKQYLGFGFENYCTEVWEYANGSITKVFEGTVEGSNGGAVNRTVYHGADGCVLREGTPNSETGNPLDNVYRIYGYGKDGFGLLTTFGYEAEDRSSFFIDDRHGVAQDEYLSFCDEYFSQFDTEGDVHILSRPNVGSAELETPMIETLMAPTELLATLRGYDE